MAISYPRELPTPSYLAQDGVDYIRPQSGGIIGGAANPVSDLGDGYWVADVMSVPDVPKAGMLAWRAWRGSLQGGLKSFLMKSPDYIYPQAHQDGSSLGTPVISAFNQANGTIDIGGLVASTTELTVGDRFSVLYAGSSHYALYTVTEGATANGSGVAQVTVAEPVLTGIAASDTVHLANPRFEAFIVPQSWEAKDGIGGRGSFKFQAMQLVRA
jgi:hypothetical protein